MCSIFSPKIATFQSFILVLSVSVSAKLHLQGVKGGAKIGKRDIMSCDVTLKLSVVNFYFKIAYLCLVSIGL